MDHLPWRSTDRPRPTVPNLCGHLKESDLCSDYESFFDWPVTQQWNRAANMAGSVLAATHQEWLFLGLANVVARRRHLRLSMPTEDSNVLDTRTITKTFLHLRWSEEQSKDVARLLHHAQYKMHINLMFELDSMRGDKTGKNGWTEDNFNVFWSTALFHEWLRGELGDKHAHSLYGREVAKYINAQTFITDRIGLGGRCTTALYRKGLSLLDTWVLLSTPLPQSVAVDQALLHVTCTGRDCKGFHIDKDNYQMQHAASCKPGDHCILRGVPAEALKTRIEGGLFPVVRSTVDRTGLHIDIVDGDDLEEFTAISHVWAGGLGNFEDNAVYECQLEGLHLALSPSKILRSTVYYWLDTLCIPVDDEAVRKKAIDDMARIYASAHSVYVLDPILQHIDVSRLTYREQAVLVAASPWMARSWTFQEAALAVRINFQFRDAVTGFSEIALPDGPLASSQLQILWHRDVDRLEDGDFSNWASPRFHVVRLNAFLIWARLIPSRLRSHRMLQIAQLTPTAKRSTPEQSLQSVWEELSQRSSKELEDVAAIIAVFIGRSAKEVLDLKPEDRTHALLWSLKSLPVYFLLRPTVNDSTGSWCPLLPTCSTVDEGLAPSNYTLNFTDEGLLELKDMDVLYPILYTGSVPLQSTYVLRISSDGNGDIQIIFPEPSVSLYEAKHGVYFIVSRYLIEMESRRRSVADLPCSQDYPDYPGICFIVKPRDCHRGTHAIYAGSFRWKVVRLDKRFVWEEPPLITSKLTSHNSRSSPSDAVGQPGSSAEGEAAALLKSPDNATIFPILLDMNIGDRKHLIWSRRKFYSFQGHSVETAKPLFVVIGLKMALVVVCIVRIVVYLAWTLAIHRPMPGPIPVLVEIMLVAAFLTTLAVFRVVLGGLEERYLRDAFRSPLQQKWASSFKVTGNGNTNPMAQYPSFRKAWPLISIYCLFTLLALTLLPLQIRFLRHRVKFVQDDNDGTLPFAVWETMVETYIGVVVYFGGDFSRFEPMSATVMPYLWLCFELVLRNSYVLWVLAHNYSPSRNADVAQTEDQQIDQIDQFDTEVSQRYRWLVSITCGAVSIFTFTAGFWCILPATGYLHDEDMVRYRAIFIIWAAGGVCWLLLGCFFASIAYSEFQNREWWLCVKIQMLARTLRRLWSRTRPHMSESSTSAAAAAEESDLDFATQLSLAEEQSRQAVEEDENQLSAR